MRNQLAAFICIAGTLLAPNLAYGGDGKLVFGWVEEGLILPEGTAVKMKLDTGALTSSMDMVRRLQLAALVKSDPAGQGL